MRPVFFDTHAHLDYETFQQDMTGVLERAWEAGIRRILAVGTDFASSRRVIELSEAHEMVYAIVGWHPCHAEEAPDDLRPELARLARHPKVVAIGETGLDFYRLPSHHEGFTEADDERYQSIQRRLFQQQLEVAADLELNCVVHQRNAFEDTLAELTPVSHRVRAVFHCFVNDEEAVQRIVALGSIVSFTGVVTFKNARDVRATAASTPSHALMLETDCPYLAPVPYRGKRCEPAYVKEIAEAVATARECSLTDLSEMTCATALQFFPKLESP